MKITLTENDIKQLIIDKINDKFSIHMSILDVQLIIDKQSSINYFVEANINLDLNS